MNDRNHRVTATKGKGSDLQKGQEEDENLFEFVFFFHAFYYIEI